MARLIEAARISAEEWTKKIEGVMLRYSETISLISQNQDLTPEGKEKQKYEAYKLARAELKSYLEKGKTELLEIADLLDKQFTAAKKKFHNSIDQDHRAKVEVIKEELAAELIGTGPVEFVEVAGEIIESGDSLRMEAARAILPQLQASFDRFYQGKGDAVARAQTVSHLSELARRLNRGLLPAGVRDTEDAAQEVHSLIGTLEVTVGLKERAISQNAPRGQWPPAGYEGREFC